MPLYGFDLISAMQDYAPSLLAVEKDRIGLQVGDPKSEIRKVLVTLDVNEEVVNEAIRIGANWIVTHHAVIFQPLKEIRTDQPVGRMFARILANHINIYVAHTNLDAAVNGVNDVLAAKIGLKNTKTLITYKEDPLKKLVVTVPVDHHEPVLQAVSEAGAGWIGNYSHCTFNVEGTGTFLPRDGANPYVGKAGELERIREIRLETVMPASLESKVIQAMLEAHPYEEVAYDIYPLHLKGTPLGFGKIGDLPKRMKLDDFAGLVKKAYACDGVRVVGDPHEQVRKVAILGGSGGRYIADAKRQGADVYITGDLDFHTAQEALAQGLSLIDPGHYIEHWVVPQVCKKLKERLNRQVEVEPSRVDTNPFRFI
ncbi:Nif3-like dinuclear metal center hexameric protein [Thermoactinomyces sp. AMNI-1]|uniref:GTP cyclohydrolase 1 type 2 homolog n=2 Tax=Thermoactinomyces mirandus TaxID=2756294 RepID=A0A7W1XP67_9BACL|nr:Nif3-like dinuclear metal center hexameric protein [Thermoactinomyces mirandus]